MPEANIVLLAIGNHVQVFTIPHFPFFGCCMIKFNYSASYTFYPEFIAVSSMPEENGMPETCAGSVISNSIILYPCLHSINYHIPEFHNYINVEICLFRDIWMYAGT
jgi:hypothetical protein